MRYDGVDGLLDEFDCYLHVGSSNDPDVLYLTEFDVPDDVVLVRTEGTSTLVVSSLEFERAKKEASVDVVRRTSDYLSGDRRGAPEARLELLDGVLSDLDVARVAVPRGFSVYLADCLRERGYDVEAVEDPVAEARTSKQPREVDAITASQRATERAMHRAEDVLSDAVVDGDVLVHEDEPLSAERLRAEIEVSLLYEGCHAEDVIVACGRRGSDPHWRGEGALRPDEPIVVDVFPRGPEGYYADMTRTFVVGEPPEAVAAAHRTTLEAMEAAFDVLDDGAGVTGETVHDAVCEVFEAAGHPTTRDDATEGFVHSTGHGVGLDLHEAPRLSESGGALPAGSVVTVEPGLYYSDWGGVRVEDLVVVRDDGFENLTEFDVDLVV